MSVRGQIDRSAPGLVRVERRRVPVDLMAAAPETVSVELTAEELQLVQLAVRNHTITARQLASRLRRKDNPELKDTAEHTAEALVKLRDRLNALA